MLNYTSTVRDFPAHVLNPITFKYDIGKQQVKRAFKIYTQFIMILINNFK